MMKKYGEMAERFKAHAWKACKGETLSWVRIPFSPPEKNLKIRFLKKIENKKNFNSNIVVIKG